VDTYLHASLCWAVLGAAALCCFKEYMSTLVVTGGYKEEY
jgi:hypothetical protein